MININLKNLSNEELQELFNSIKKELEERKPKKEVLIMNKIKAKMVVDYLLNMLAMGIVTDEEIKDVANTICYILEANNMVEEYLSKF